MDDRIESLPQRNAFISLKDHEPNFYNNPKCRLINPTKSEIGKISKIILDDVNSNIRSRLGLNQWRNTTAVISWFQNIPNKNSFKFMKFDIVEFYPSISENLLWKALHFAKQYTDIKQESIDIIMHSRKLLLFCDGNTWVKKGNQLFDVTMGSYDGAEICELVGLFLLKHMENIFDREYVGLYRDDGLAVLKNTSGPQTDRIRKQLIKLFQEHGLKITVELNLIQTDFLDVTFNLNTRKFWPYRKPNDSPLYINKQSNHPPSIKKQIPAMINDRLTQLSASEEEFKKAAPIYDQALQASGYNTNLEYNSKSSRRRNTRRKRNIVWFNPPFSDHVDTNIGQEFLKLVDKHFPPHHKLRKICNRNSIKISYSCMPNMATIISGHNKSILSKSNTPYLAPEIPTTPTSLCNCRVKPDCPLSGECKRKSIVYKATITTGKSTKIYFGSCSTDFKTRYNNHKQSFNHQNKRNSTELSKEVWRAKDKGIQPKIKWSIVRSAPDYKCGSRRCNLCLAEKLTILFGDKNLMLNKRSEILGKCRHTTKYKLKSIKFDGSI